MQDYVKSLIERIESFGKEKNETIELLIIGGIAMAFYGLPRYTSDIDAEIKCSDEVYFELLEHLKKDKIAFNIGEDISAWGIIPLPTGYRERAKIVYRGEFLILKVLEPIDFVFSKLRRGTEEDIRDAIEVIRRFDIRKDKLIGHERLIKYPKDPETLFFKKKFQHLMKIMEYQ